MYPFLTLGGLVLPSYGLMMVLGVALSVTGTLWRCRHAGLDETAAVVLMGSAGLGALLGARLLYVLVSVLPMACRQQVTGAQLWQALTSGGQVFYGGVLGGIAGAWLGLALTRVPAERYLQAAVPMLPAGHALGRVGCLLAGCCYGIPYDGPLAVTFSAAVGGAPAGVPLFPVQVVESLWDLTLSAFLLWRSHRGDSGRHLTAWALLLYGAGRFGLEFLRGDALRGALMMLSTSQWISLSLMAAAVLLLASERPARS